MNCTKFIAILLVFASLHVVAQEIPGDGSPITLDLPAGPSGGNVFVEVPAGSQELKISVTGDAGTDVGVLARFGSAFDLGVDLGPQIEFLSVGPDHTEHLTITHASQPALRAGRWWLAVINWGDTPNSLEISAIVSDNPELDPLEFEVVWDSQEIDGETGFWDAAPFNSPNNPGQTVGEARRLALEEALRIASEGLTAAGATSPVPVMIAATFEDLGGFEDDLITLAHARPFTFFLSDGFFGLHQAGTWYPTPLISKQVGTDMCRTLQFHVPPDDDDGSFEPILDCNTPDALLTFNSHEDINWSYALGSVSHPADFISTAMHEVMHGLGFVSLFPLEDDEDGEFEAGELERGFADIYTHNLVHVSGNQTPLADLDNTGRIQAATSVSNLRWAGANVAASPGNPFAGLEQYFRMYAPATVRPGSSVSHVDSGSPVAASELMRPTSSNFSPRNIGHTGAFMLDLGWGGGQVLGSAGHPIHFGMNGLWYNPETSGQGFLFDIAATQDPPQATAFWFTFADQAGGPESQRWYTAQGDYSEGDTSVTMTVYMTTGGAFDRRPPVPETNPVGEMTLAFQSCDEATLTYDFDLDNDPVKRVQGVVPVSRLSPDIYCKTGMDPEEVPFIDPPPPVVLSPVLNGSWYEPATSGQGLLFDVVEDQDPPQLVALWFTFAETAGGAQRQRWFLAQGDYTPGDREVTLDVRMSLGGEFDRRPPVPELVTVGTAELEFESCTEAEFEYDINLDNVPGEGTEGRIALRRLTPDILCHKGLR